MGIQDLPFIFVGFLVQSYKWLELRIMQLFRSTLERRVRKTYAKLGVIFDETNEGDKQTGSNNNNNDTSSSLTKSGRFVDEKNVAKVSEFDGIIHVKVHDKIFYTRVANQASMGMGETYMDENWDCDNLTELFRRIMRKKVFLEYLNPWNRFLNYIELCFFNLQTQSKAWEVGKKHYDLGNDLFESFLDPWLTYSCGYWANADNLNDAQVQKMELIAKKLQLKPGMRVLDIGCGWGGLVKYLASKYGVECVGITISEEGVKYAKKSCQGLLVDIRLIDYRDLNEQFDRIVSVGMMEHVGGHNHREYFEVAHRCLKDDGIFLLHTIGINHKEIVPIEPWFHTYIFPNGYLPSCREITEKTEGLFIVEDWHNFGPDYAKTLHAWLANFNKNWHKHAHKYGERFYRMWTYYLQSSAGGFESRMIQLWQVVLSKDGLDNYRAPR